MKKALTFKKVLVISPEVYPKVKVGGLGRMVAGASKGLAKLGAEVKVISPDQNIYHPLWQKKTQEKYRVLGQKASGWSYANNYQPDWIWVHDWGGVWAAAEFKKTNNAKTLWTVHSPIADSYGYQYGYSYESESEGDPIDWGDSFFDFSALIEQGIALSNKVTTVSPTFARYLQRSKLFSSAKKITGIGNGIDYQEWDPAKDNLISFNLKNSWLEFKRRNKKVLQKKLGLPQLDVPIFCFVSRVVPQKGVELLTKALPEFLAKNEIQFILVGSGSRKLTQCIDTLKQKFSGQMGVRLVADFDLPHQVFAGSDFLVLPSVSEPFGIVVAEARKYGVVPIVHLVDGLVDQVKDKQDGFGFRKYQKDLFLGKLYEALDSYQSEWQYRQLGNLGKVESWETVAKNWLGLLNE